MHARGLRPGDGALHRVVPCKTVFALLGCRRMYVTRVLITGDFSLSERYFPQRLELCGARRCHLAWSSSFPGGFRVQVGLAGKEEREESGLRKVRKRGSRSLAEDRGERV